MRRWLVSLMVALLLSPAVGAQDTQLRRLDSGADAAGWEAVGRLNIGGAGFCTGALIAPNLVLTAGHCLFDKSSGQRIDHTRVEFLAGWRNGRASAYRNVRRAVVHPDYSHAGHVSSEGVRNDLALLELDHPIRNGKILPFETAARPRRGAEVGVVSYGTGRSEAPSLQELCHVLAQQDGLLVTSCAVEFGSSGAPIFVIDDGQAQIVSVISAKAEVEGRAVSLGTSLGAPLARLQAELVAQRGDVSPRISSGFRRETGAKFVKP